MPDIAMCSGQGCTKRQTCYRYTATPNGLRQAYIKIADPVNCDMFYPVVRWEPKVVPDER